MTNGILEYTEMTVSIFFEPEHEVIMVYKFKSGSYIKADPQLAGAVLERLEAENNLTAKALVDESRPEDAPLHNEFEWNDSAAAEKYREQQARHIIHSIEIVREESEPVRAFFNIERKDPQYRHIEAIMRKADDRQALIRNALNEFMAVKRKYEQLSELAAIFDAIDQAKEANNG